MKSLEACRLYTFVDTAYLRGRSPEMVARQLCAGGSDLVQLRAKKSTPAEVEQMARSIAPILREANVGLVINDFPAVAASVGADLCHLGQEDFFESGHTKARDVWNGVSTVQKSSCGLGLSTHAPAQAERALAAGPDYIAIGPVYATGTKPTARPVTLDYVRWAAATVKLPWFAIGGINLQTIDAVLAAGAKRICVVSAILNADDIAAECQKYRERVDA
jgi:thiamine-phosphate pyrophosphorylase